MEITEGVVAMGDCADGLWAVYAAALDERIVAVAARRRLASYQHVVEHPSATSIQNDRMTSVVAPGALKWSELPNLASVVAPRHLRLSGLVDGPNRPLSQDELADTHARTAQRYEALGAAGKLLLPESSDVTDRQGPGA